MPPRQNPPPNGSPRRRPGPLMPTSWIWLVFVLLAVSLLLLPPFGTGTPIDYSDFQDLVKKGKVAKVVFQGKDRVVGEVKDAADEEVKTKLKIRNGRFVTQLPPLKDVDNLVAEIR